MSYTKTSEQFNHELPFHYRNGTPWVRVWDNGKWSIAINREKREIMVSNGWRCAYGYWHASENIIRYDIVPPKYVRAAAIQVCKRFGVVSIYDEK